MIYARLFVLLPLLSLFLAFGFPVTAYPQATLTVENAADVTGTCTTVDVSLGHADDVRGVQLDICDSGNHLVALGCKPAARVPTGYSCTTNELVDGCATVILFPSGEPISPGTGPVLTITYGVFWDAPVNDLPYTPEDDTYSLLVPNGVRVADNNGDPLPSVDVVAGSFHFIEGCTTDADCPDDGVYCNGIAVCQTGQCVVTAPCPPGIFCDEDLDVCRGTCTIDQECDDGLFCNGVETCQYVPAVDASFCTPGVDSCAEPTPLCDETNDLCVECLDEGDCNDDLFCNGTEVCVAGSCQAGLPSCPPLAICDEASDECLCSSDADCDDGLFCNGVETCGSFSGTCDIDFNYLTKYPCRNCQPNFLDCDCNEVSDSCQPATLTVGSGSGLPGSTDNFVAVSLDTLFLDVVGVQMEVCDPDDLFLTCSGCEIAGRTPGAFGCSAAEQPGGCCEILLFDFALSGATIDAGTGPVLNINYSVDGNAPVGGCRLLEPRNVNVSVSNFSLAVDTLPGDFCFSAGAQASFAASSSELLSSAASPTAPSAVGSGDQIGGEASTTLGKDLWEELLGRAGGDSELFPFTISETCPLVTSLDDPEDLAILRDFRDKVLSQDVSGVIFTFLFYRNAPEVTNLINQHEELKEKIRLMVDEYSSLINEVSNGGTVYLQESDKAGIIELLKEIKAQGSPQLKADIDLVMGELNGGNVEELFGFTSEN